MNWDKLSKAVGQFAPLAGTLLGGPPGAAIGALVANALGVENNPDAVGLAIAKDPEAGVKLRALEMKHAERFEELALDLTRAELADTQNARAEHKHSRMPATICVVLTMIVAGAGYMIMTTAIPPGNKEIAYMLFGQVTALWGASVQYWVGTTRSSAEKDRRLSR